MLFLEKPEEPLISNDKILQKYKFYYDQICLLLLVQNYTLKTAYHFLPVNAYELFTMGSSHNFTSITTPSFWQSDLRQPRSLQLELG